MPKPSSQAIVDIQEIKDDVLILKDGSIRALLMVSGVNFDLMSEDEQNALTGNFQNFLNSLDFVVQVVIQSRNMNIGNYLTEMEQWKLQEKDPLIKFQIENYIEFVKSFTEKANIMTKNFYVVVPYEKTISGGGIEKGVLSVFKGGGSDAKAAQVDFRAMLSQLETRIDHIVTGLRPLGINVVRLGNEELTELFYNLYNPEKTMRSEPEILKILGRT